MFFFIWNTHMYTLASCWVVHVGTHFTVPVVCYFDNLLQLKSHQRKQKPTQKYTLIWGFWMALTFSGLLPWSTHEHTHTLWDQLEVQWWKKFRHQINWFFVKWSCLCLLFFNKQLTAFSLRPLNSDPKMFNCLVCFVRQGNCVGYLLSV